MSKQSDLDEIGVDLWVRYGRPGTMDEFTPDLKQAILDWHNKQIDETVRMIHGRHDIRCAKCYEELGVNKPEEAEL